MTKYNRPYKLNGEEDKRYPKNWNALRQAMFRECGYRCQLCNKYSKGDLNLHHIVPLGYGGSNSKYNLIPICSQCHFNVHQKKGKIKL